MFTGRKPLYPVPEAIVRPDIAEAFDIEDGYTSTTDFAKRRMVVPTGGACMECGHDHARAARLMEMGKTAWSPADIDKRVKRTKDKLPLALVEACEKARIHGRRSKARMEPAPMMLCEQEQEHYFTVRQLARSGDMLTLAGYIASTYRSGDEEPVKRAVIKVIGELRSKADEMEHIKAAGIEQMYTSVISHTRWHFGGWATPTFRYTLALARDIINILNGVASSMEKAIEDAKLAKEAKVKVYGNEKKKGTPTDVKFGEMSIVELPLPYRSKAGFERRWTARDEGDIPTRFDRWAIDKRIFRAKKKGKGAALLVDVSGSMAWSEADLARVLDEVPAATIAIYSGSGKTGKLVIVARKGRAASMTTAARYMLGGNVIDGPALEWLSEQPETVKIWMSDGGITGLNDGWSGDRAMDYCGKILRKAGIQQVRNAKSVMEVLTGKRPFTPSKKVSQSDWE